ncbi:MAG: EamA family transporter [Nitrospiraceae bacterium]|nr:EamA family transporter [Nitrospiraceae bacterium]
MKTIAIIFVAALCAAVGETFLSYGMRRIGGIDWREPARWLGWFGTIITSPSIIAGTALLACFFFLYLISLSQADLSFVMPLTAFSYIFAAFMARAFLKEEISWLRWSGIVIIIVGITLIAMGSGNTAPAPSHSAKAENAAASGPQ